MEIGKRNRRITFFEFQSFKNDEGVYVKHWGEMCKLWAYVKPLSGKEVYAAQAHEHKATIKANIRYNSLIVEGLRVEIYGEKYDVLYVEDVDMRHVEMWLTLEKVI